MKCTYKLLLLITLFTTQSNIIVLGQECINSTDHATQTNTTQETIDKELYDLFQKFFDDQDDMSFNHFVTKIIDLLQSQKSLLSDHMQTQCQAMITKFEQNKHNAAFHIWVPILSDPHLRNIMSLKTRTYINNVPTTTKISALMNKLRK